MKIFTAVLIINIYKFDIIATDAVKDLSERIDPSHDYGLEIITTVPF
jgi:hypothetical protein